MPYHQSGKLRSVSGGGLMTLAKLQWQPILTAHDPNPPITLETEVVVGGLSLLIAAYHYNHHLTSMT